MKLKGELKLLLLTLLLLAIVPAGVLLRPQRTIALNGAYYETSAEGDRFALAHLSSRLLNKEDWTSIGYEYRTPAKYGKTQLWTEWYYVLLYNRRDKTLTKTLYHQLSPDHAPPNRTWRWQNVEENAIHQVVAPMRDKDGAIFNEKVSAYQGGKLEELEIYGAILAPEPNSR